MKAITLHQPYASLIALGKKQYETRSWSTNYRGKIAVHAGLSKKALTQDGYALWQRAGLGQTSFAMLPLGEIIAIADLTDCIKMTDELIGSASELERTVGNWKLGNYAWRLENIQVLSEPIPYKGKQGLWEYNNLGEV